MIAVCRICTDEPKRTGSALKAGTWRAMTFPTPSQAAQSLDLGLAPSDRRSAHSGLT